MPQLSKSARILLVDHDRSSTNRLLGILRSAGYTQVTSAGSGRRALEVCSRELPELLIIDPWLEGGTGYQVLESLAGQANGHGMPRCLFVTADASEGPRIQAELFGARAVMEKPCDANVVLHQVSTALEV